MFTQNHKYLMGFFLSLVTLTVVLAVDPEVQAYINDGDTFVAQGNNFSAEKMYVNAKGVAVDKEDVDGLLVLTRRFLLIKSDYHAHDSYYLANDFAETICTFAANAANPAAECARGIAAMNSCIAAGQNILATVTMTAETAGKLRNTLQIATDNAQGYQQKGCPR